MDGRGRFCYVQLRNGGESCLYEVWDKDIIVGMLTDNHSLLEFTIAISELNELEGLRERMFSKTTSWR